jgi:hypothetical protein
MESEAKNEALKLIAQVIKLLESPEAEAIEKTVLIDILKGVVDRLAS